MGVGISLRRHGCCSPNTLEPAAILAGIYAFRPMRRGWQKGSVGRIALNLHALIGSNLPGFACLIGLEIRPCDIFSHSMT